VRSDWSGGHPPLRGSPSYPYGHPGYFNGTHAVSARVSNQLLNIVSVCVCARGFLRLF
jgi:hypothetical protein